MNTWTKRGTLLILAALMLVVGMMIPYRNAEAAMTYNNTNYASLTCSVNPATGELQASLNVDGKKGITSQIETELYVEKQILGIIWKRVDIGCVNNLWIDSTTSYHYTNTFSTILSSSGTYRIVVKYTVSGSGGPSDVIMKTENISY